MNVEKRVFKQQGALQRAFNQKLKNIPAPGGNGCHCALLGVANLGVALGYDDDALRRIMRQHIPAGTREVTDTEIYEAIDKARSDAGTYIGGQSQVRAADSARTANTSAALLKLLNMPQNKSKFQDIIYQQGQGKLNLLSASARAVSPIPIPDIAQVNDDKILLLQTLYAPDDLIYIGPRNAWGSEQRAHIKSASEWIQFFQTQDQTTTDWHEEYAQINPNPVTGTIGKTQAGKSTWRGDACVKDYRYVVAEIDGTSAEYQEAALGWLLSQGIQIAAIIFSGSASYHAWLGAPPGIHNQTDWDTKVKDQLFSILEPIGFDPACKNPSRLSRLPGIYRADKCGWQKLIYLNK